MKGLVRNSKQANVLRKCLDKLGSTVHLEQMVGGAYSLYAAGTVERMGGIHIFLTDDRDSAAYLVNDLYELLGEERVEFFSSGYKRSAAYGSEDANVWPTVAERNTHSLRITAYDVGAPFARSLDDSKR